MENISPDDLALELLNQCLRGNSHSRDLLETLVRMATGQDPERARRASRALFRTVVERLADEFEPCLCDAYTNLFADVLEAVLALPAAGLVERYRRIRYPRPCKDGAEAVIVLSRVTLGADVAVTSILLDAARRRFPRAEIWFAGPAKNHRLFAADAGIRLLEVPYPREGTLAERLSNFAALGAALAMPGAIVIDPDSRLTQLGLLPVGAEDRYFFFESRSYGGYGSESLVALTKRWAAQVFGIEDAAAFLAPAPPFAPSADITVSLGVGDNQAKRLGDAFERGLLAELAGTGASILIDRGGSAEEAARVDRAIAGLPNVRTWTGDFAPFAASIARSRLYCGYDSAGQHVAAASGTPLLTIFAGHPSERMFQRWRPEGPGRAEVIRVETESADEVLGRCRRFIAGLPHEDGNRTLA